MNERHIAEAYRFYPRGGRFVYCVLRDDVEMSLVNGEVVTPSIDHCQPQMVVSPQHTQLRAPTQHLQMETGSGNPPSDVDDAIVKMASEVTADVISSAVRTYAAGHIDDTGGELDRKYCPPVSNFEEASLTQTSVTGNESASRPRDVAAVSNHHRSEPEVAAASDDGPEAEALQDLARLQALTRQLRAAVSESRSADGLPTEVDDETRTSQNTDQRGRQTTTVSTANNEMVH